MTIAREHICNCLNNVDIMGLLVFPVMAPMDEYEEEAQMIYDWLLKRDGVTVDALTAEINRVFEKAFGGADFDRDTIKECARMILQKSTRCLCPVCRKHWFEKMGDYEKCPVCRWENELSQWEHLSGAGGTNRLNVYELQLEYLLANDSEAEEFLQMKMQYEEENRQLWTEVDAVREVQGEDAEKLYRRLREHDEAYVKKMLGFYLEKVCKRKHDATVELEALFYEMTEKAKQNRFLNL